MSKFFCLPNLSTDSVTVSEKPWDDFKIAQEILDLPKEDYKKRWFNPETRHCLWNLAEGQNPDYIVSQGNQASKLYGFAADYDGVFTPDMIEAVKEKAPSKYKPAYWCLSQSKKLHLIWFFDRPMTVTGNAHANALIKIIASKIRAIRWGVGYDPECENVTQVMDIGREWHVFKEHAAISTEEIIMWDLTIFEKSIRNLVEEVVDIPMDVVAEEIKKRTWPLQPPTDFHVGVRCRRFWDPQADNPSAAMVCKDGLRVFTPHDGHFKSWKSLLGPEFCEAYTSKSMAPFFEDTTYCHTKDEYHRFFRNDNPPHYEKRTEKVLRRDLMQEAHLNPKPDKGKTQSELDDALYTITRKNVVDAVAPILYRPCGRIYVNGIGSVLNTSMVTVIKPAERFSTITPEDIAKYPSVPEAYKENPTICTWDNPFVTRTFPHIHRLLTAFFVRSQTIYDTWISKGAESYDSDGRMFQPLADVQLTYLLSWVSHFYKNSARMSQDPGRGQALILAGPPGTGKSFFGRVIMKLLMGGMTDADEFYLKGSRFNAGIVSSPLHLIDDKLGAKSQHTRLAFTEALKIVVANAVMRYEAKFGSAIETIPWPGRVIILSNDDAQSLSVMPDLDMSTRDKFMMLKLSGAKFDWGTDSENMKWVAEELPYFARFLLGWTIPVDIRDSRFGVRAIQHADMAQASAENGLTQVLVEVLETCIDSVTGGKDVEDSSDRNGFAIEGNAVKIFKWIKSVDDSLAREIMDSRTLQQCLATLYKNGGYNISMDEETKRWRIPYVLRKNS